MTIIDEVIENFNVNNFYDVLRIPKRASREEIKRAYLQRSLEWHPDKSGNSEDGANTSKKFQILTRIYQILSDPRKRDDYDKQFIPLINANEDLDSFARYDEINLNDCGEQDEFYYSDCRCSGQFRLSKEHLVAPQNSCQNIFVIDCDSCSNTIKIVL